MIVVLGQVRPCPAFPVAIHTHPMTLMLRTFFVAALVAATLSAALVRAAPPNVILILADDLGYETIGANGGTSYKTPALDKLAAGGVRFTHCYVQPLCTPTRVQLMTGKYNVRNYIDFGNMDKEAVTFGNYFQKAGYKTLMAGKWQLGHDWELPKKYRSEEHTSELQ